MDRDAAMSDLEALYAELEAELAARNPRCELSGRCCRFKDYGHQLWTTDLELEYLFRGVSPRAGEGVCPYLEAGRCGARSHRMLGCRIHFCDPGFKDEMGPLYERYHRRVKEIHARHGIPYAYGELLAKLATSPARPPGGP